MADKVHPMDSFHPTAPAFSRSSSTTSSSVAIQIPDQRMINREQEQSLIRADDQAYKQKDFIYKTPTPLPPDHPSYRARPRRRGRSPCCCCFAWVCSILAIILILLGVAALVLYLVLEPKAPQFSVTDATISTLNVTTQPILASNASPGVSGLYLNADVTFVVQAENPNKKIGIYYDAVDVTLFYEGAEIGTGSIPAFYQGHQSTTSLDLRMKGDDVLLTPSIGLALQNSLRSDGGSIPLKARTIAQVRIKVGSWKSRDSKFEVDCDVQISNPAAGNPHLLSKSCTFKVKSLML